MITLQDIAKRVGVSHAVVSSVLNRRTGTVRVSEAKRLKILEVAAELGYVPNRSARTLATRRNRALGLIVNYPRLGQMTTHGSAYVMGILNGIHQVCDPLDYRCVYALADMQSPAAFTLPRFVSEQSVDGVVLAGYVHRQVEEALLATGIPMMHVGTNVDEDSRLDSVYADMEGAVCQLLDAAAAEGITRVHLHLPNGPGPRKITAAFAGYARKHHPRLEATVAHSPGSATTFEESCAHGAQLARLPRPPQLLIANMDAGQVFLSEFQKQNISCPGGIELVAFASEGYHEQRWGNQYLRVSQIVLPFSEVSRRIARGLIGRLDKTTGAIASLVPCEFLAGETAPSLSARKWPESAPLPLI
ncbi:MAG TPA: LacI family DNA-binding transcriptional regulator [Chthoniobacteraceae bacterium]|nr:LacI family DNA-binding transcriptional regulator [Chthoniobacteraceae bacterium]